MCFFLIHVSAGIKCLCIYTLTYENILKNKLDVYNLFSTAFPLISTNLLNSIICSDAEKGFSSYQLYIVFHYRVDCL